MCDPEVQIPVYILNIAGNNDIHLNAHATFSDRIEFAIAWEDTAYHINNIISTWDKIKNCVKHAISQEEDVIILCDTACQFSDSYNYNSLIDAVVEAASFNSDILLGQLNSFNQAVPVNDHIFWIDAFDYSPFIIIYRNFYEAILTTEIEEQQSIGEILSYLTSKKLTVFPFFTTTAPWHPVTGLAKTPALKESGEKLALHRAIYERYIAGR